MCRYQQRKVKKGTCCLQREKVNLSDSKAASVARELTFRSFSGLLLQVLPVSLTFLTFPCRSCSDFTYCTRVSVFHRCSAERLELELLSVTFPQSAQTPNSNQYLLWLPLKKAPVLLCTQFYSCTCLSSPVFLFSLLRLFKLMLRSGLCCWAPWSSCGWRKMYESEFQGTKHFHLVAAM